MPSPPSFAWSWHLPFSLIPHFHHPAVILPEYLSQLLPDSSEDVANSLADTTSLGDFIPRKATHLLDSAVCLFEAFAGFP